ERPRPCRRQPRLGAPRPGVRWLADLRAQGPAGRQKSRHLVTAALLDRSHGMRTLLLLGLVGCASASGEPRVADQGPIVIELFTSQGCSSCPPADALLDKLARAGELAGRKLAPPSLH